MSARGVGFGSVCAAVGLGLAAAVSPAASAVSPPAALAAPVTVDNSDGTHTVTLPVTGDTWVSNWGATTSQADSPELRVGSTFFGIIKSRSYLDFDYSALAGVPADAVVTSAELTLSNYTAGACTGSATRLSRVTSDWSVAGLTWGAQPAVTSTGSTATTQAFGAKGCEAEGTVTFDATGIVAAWVKGATERGVQVKADREGSTKGYRQYRSSEYDAGAKAPQLSVTYDSYPDTPADLAVTPGNSPYVTSLTPTLTTTLSDPDGGQVCGYVEVRQGTTASSPVVWSGSTDPVDSGHEASLTLPGEVLTDGGVYTVAVYGDDGALRSKTPAVTAFKVDVTAPEVTITSDEFTDGTWTNPMPASAAFTLDGSPDTAGFYVTVDGTELPPVGADGSGDHTSTVKSTPGWHTIEATPVDRAGNRGETTTFSYGTGTPTFTQPTQWQSSTTGDFPVSISAPPNATSMTLSWQVWGEKTWHTAAHLAAGDTPWDGVPTTDGGRSTTGDLTWHATQEPLGAGTLTAPALLQAHACFHYADRDDECTPNVYLVLNQAQ